MVSSRCPLDAEKRYLQQHDSSDWMSRLRVVGADFRAENDVFALVNAVITCLKEWSSEGKPKLDILINNAAQTLTDTIEKERNSVRREAELSDGSSPMISLNTNYQPRITGGIISQHIKFIPMTQNVDPMAETAQKDATTAMISQSTAGSSWI